MSKGLMTARELSERYRPELALDLAIEKYERLRDPCNWDVLRKDRDDYVGGGTCALCTRYPCESCPLGDCSGDDTLWSNVVSALMKGDRDAFLEACDDMLSALRKAEKAKPVELEVKVCVDEDGDLCADNGCIDNRGRNMSCLKGYKVIGIKPITVTPGEGLEDCINEVTK